MTTTGAQSRIRMHREAAYNTAPTADFWNIPFTDSSLGIEQPNEKSPVLGQGSDPQKPFRGTKNGAGDISVPIDARNFGLHLAALFGDPVSTHPSGYQHVFQSGAAGMPTPQSFEVYHPGLTVAKYAMNTGVMYSGMEVNLARSGLATAKFNLVGTDEVWGEASGAGTPADLVAATLKYFSHLTGVIKLDTVAIGTILSGSFSFNNNLDVAEVVANNGLIAGGVRGEGEGSVKLTSRFKDVTHLDLAIAGTPVNVEFSLTNSGTEKITFLMPKVIFARPKVPISGPSGLQLSLDGMIYGDASTKALTATLLNDHDGTAYAPPV